MNINLQVSIFVIFMSVLNACGKTAATRRGNHSNIPAAGNFSEPQNNWSGSEDSFMLMLPNPINKISVSKPCPNRAGSLVDPDQGSGICSGNLLTIIPLPTINSSLVHNSLLANQDNGIGNGWNFPLRSQLILSQGDKVLTMTNGDGSQLVFNAATKAGPWLTSDPRVSRSSFALSGSNIVRSDVGGMRISYTLLKGNTYLINRIDNSNGTYIAVSRSSTSETWSSSFGTIATLVITGKVVSAINDANGKAYTLNYNANNDLTNVVYPDGSRWTLEYVDAKSSLIGGIANPMGDQTRFAYWKTGEIRSVVDSKNYTTNFSYSASSVAVRNLFSETFETFNSAKKLISTRSNGLTTTINRDGDGRITSIVSPIGTTTNYSYSGSSVYPETSESGVTKNTFSYDSNLNVTQIVESSGGESLTTKYEYDSLQRISATIINNIREEIVRDAKGNVQGTSFDSSAMLASVSYDGRGLPTTVTDPWGLKTLRQYDPSSGYLSSVTDALGATTTMTTDKLGQPLSWSSPDGSGTAAFDAGGKLTSWSVTPPSGAQGSTIASTYNYQIGNGFQMSSNTTVDGNPIATSTEAFAATGEFISSAEGRLETSIGSSSGNSLALGETLGSALIGPPVLSNSAQGCKTMPKLTPPLVPAKTYKLSISGCKGSVTVAGKTFQKTSDTGVSIFDLDPISPGVCGNAAQVSATPSTNISMTIGTQGPFSTSPQEIAGRPGDIQVSFEGPCPPTPTQTQVATATQTATPTPPTKSQLTIKLEGTGAVFVDSDPGSTFSLTPSTGSFTSTSTGSLTFMFDRQNPPIVVSINARPKQYDGNYTIFEGWGGCDFINGSLCQVAMDKDRTVTLKATKQPRNSKLTVILEPGANPNLRVKGTVSFSFKGEANGPSINIAACEFDSSKPTTTPCIRDVPTFASGTLTASSPNIEYFAADWDGDCTSNGVNCDIAPHMEQDRTVFIRFAQSNGANVTFKIDSTLSASGTFSSANCGSDPINVTSTKEVIRFCSKGKAAIQYKRGTSASNNYLLWVDAAGPNLTGPDTQTYSFVSTPITPESVYETVRFDIAQLPDVDGTTVPYTVTAHYGPVKPPTTTTTSTTRQRTPRKTPYIYIPKYSSSVVPSGTTSAPPPPPLPPGCGRASCHVAPQ